MKNPVVWFEIHVDDMARAQKFYETVLDIQFTDLDDPNDGSIIMKAFPNDDEYGATGALVKMEGAPVGANSVMVYLRCDDCAVEEARVEAAGGTLMQSKLAIGKFGYISIAEDTEGNTFGLHSEA